MSQGIGRKISSLRKSKNITQTELAQLLFVTPQTVSKWESGNGTPDIVLIPKIANLFEVSLDFLFDMTDAQRVKDTILKYSVLKDDHSFETARSMIDILLEDPGVESGQKAEFYALKSHLYLQKARDSINEALEATDKALQCTPASDRTPLIMQTYLLRLMNGEYENVKQESRKVFSEKPDVENLYIFLEVLMILNNYEEVIAVVEKDESVKDLMKNKTESLKVWMQYFQAVGHAYNLEKAKALYEELQDMATDQDLFTMSMFMAKLLSQNGDSGLNHMKDIVFSLLDRLDYNEYIRKEISDHIQEL